MVDAATNLEEGSIASQECVDEYRKELIDQNIGTYQVSIPRTVKKIGNTRNVGRCYGYYLN